MRFGSRPFSVRCTFTVTSVLIAPSRPATLSSPVIVPTTTASAARTSVRSLMLTNVVASAAVPARARRKGTNVPGRRRTVIWGVLPRPRGGRAEAVSGSNPDARARHLPCGKKCLEIPTVRRARPAPGA